MASVYRRGTKDVHRSILDGGVPFDHRPCSFDEGGTWGPAIPPGPRCGVCFRGVSTRRQPGGRGRRPALVAATTAAVLAAAVVLASSVDTPVTILGPFETASATPSLPALFPSVTPGPSELPLPTETSVLTPPPVATLPPLPTYPPVPTFGPLPTWPPFPPFPVLPTVPPLPTLSPPGPVPCIHPGLHQGVDPCRWPHQ